jgi:hypothetical protein
MKHPWKSLKTFTGGSLALVGLAAGSDLAIPPAEAGLRISSNPPAVLAIAPRARAEAGGGGSGPVVIESLEATGPNGEAAKNNVGWLGVSTTEASEALVAQLNLDPGVGLVVSYVTPDSPAAKAGLQKNDLLVRLENQSLVHPSQLRKLVQTRKEGDPVKLVYYRAGKEQTATITLGKSPRPFALLDEERVLRLDLDGYYQQFKDLRLEENLRQHLDTAKQAMGNIKLDSKRVQEEVRRGVEEAKKALKEALRSLDEDDAATAPTRKALEALGEDGAKVEKNATVVIRKTGQQAQSLVQTDDSGTIVIVGNPNLRLTAHDRKGELLFDGEIETKEQRAKVPAELWKRVEPLVDKLSSGHAEDPAGKE